MRSGTFRCVGDYVLALAQGTKSNHPFKTSEVDSSQVTCSGNWATLNATLSVTNCSFELSAIVLRTERTETTLQSGFFNDHPPDAEHGVFLLVEIRTPIGAFAIAAQPSICSRINLLNWQKGCSHRQNERSEWLLQENQIQLLCP